VVLQTEAAECGLACLAMVASYHGLQVDLKTLRRKFPISLKGTTLAALSEMSQSLDLGTRPVKLQMDALDRLRLPCILHWNFNHFVVLKDVRPNSVTVHDPGAGARKLSLAECSRSFTGVALEQWPNPQFQKADQRQAVKLRDLVGKVSGLRRSLGQILLLGLALEVFAIVSPFFLQWAIDDVVAAADQPLLTTLGIGFAILMLLQQAITAVRGWLIMYIGSTISIQWRANVFTHLLRLPLQYFEKRHLGDIVSRFASLDQIQQTLTTSFVEAIVDGMMAAGTLLVILIYSPGLSCVSIGAMLLYALSRSMWYRPLRSATEQQIIHTAKQQSHFLESVRGAKTIKLFQRNDERRTGWLALVVDQINAGLLTQKLKLFYTTANGLVFGLENVIVIWLGTRLVLQGQFSVGMLTAFMAYRTQFATRVGSLIDEYFDLKMLQLQGERLADIVLTEAENTEGGQYRSFDASSLEPSIELCGVQYRYAQHEPYVLDGVSLKIAAGESVAIVGPSGCGKTTLLHAILGVLPPTSGHILIGGVSTTHIGAATTRRMTGTVMQDDALFAGSIADNISFFDPEADQHWIEECARIASIHSDIQSMPMGYNTMVGYYGSVLSGGQKQRVLLARALYKRPGILLLDEATSHLDLKRELLVSTAVRELNITRVIVAHRPQTIMTADRVARLAHGRIVEDSRPGADFITQAGNPGGA